MKQTLSFLLLGYFRVLAQLQLKKINPKIIGMTGSAGKTSTLQACEAVLKSQFKLKVSHKANSESGIPLNILDLHPVDYSPADWLRLAIQAPLQLLFNWKKYDIYLVEMGIDGPHKPKNMSYLLDIIQPDLGIFLNVAPVHAAAFDHLVKSATLEERKAELISLIAEEKGRLLTSLSSSGVAIINADDHAVRQFASRTSAKVLTYGFEQADIQVLAVSWTESSSIYKFKYLDKSYKLSINGYILPKSYAYTLTAALGTGISQGMSFAAAVSSLEKYFSLPPGRSSLIEGSNGSTIIDSTYNASTQPMLDMLDLLSSFPKKRKLVLLGDMRELGEVAEHEHQIVAQKVVQVVDTAYLVGPLMKKYVFPILKSKKVPVQWFANAVEAATQLKPQLDKNDVLLVKASQNTLLLESAVEVLMARPETADQLLCRRGKYWDQQRAKLRSHS